MRVNDKKENMNCTDLKGVWWSMKDLEERINRKQQWIKKYILYQPKFKELLDIDNGGFVFYPKKPGQTWTFQATKMSDFLEKNFAEIHKQF